MRAYLAIAVGDPGTRIPPAVLAAARLAIGDAVPVPAELWRREEWISSGHRVALLAWSNEPAGGALPEPLLETGDRALGYAGYLGDRKRDEDLLLTADDPDAVVDTLGGVFSVFRADPGGFTALTSITRACPVYHAEAGGLRFAGTRAILVHLAARAAETGLVRSEPDYDVLGLQCMVRHGFYVSDGTPFRGVSAVPNAGGFTARTGGPARVTARPLPEPGPVPRSRRAARRAIEPLAEALLAACEPFRGYDRPVRLALSGGRDSRLIAAALYARDIPFLGATHGFADHPDVVLSKRVADLLGAEWTCDYTVPDENAAITVPHPVLRCLDVVRMCEGMNSGYEDVHTFAPYDPEPRSSGSGGERLRGGFLTDTADLSPAGVEKRLKTIFAAQDHLMTPAARERARPDHERWLERSRTEGLDVLDKLHMFYRTGRWLAGSHTAVLMKWAYHHPFLDARVVREALALPVEWRLTEEPVHLLIRRLAPQLADVPFDARRWRFESDGPRSRWERAAWRARAPLPATGVTFGFNWRRKYGAEFAAAAREHILDGPSQLWEIVDRSAVEPMLHEVPPRRPSQAWNLLSLSILLSNRWREPSPDLPPVTIPVG
ncbi:hypothetical protein DPM19_16420 [Actinomadura craniellae]|uniref:Asparagine synthetase domain-containing protein n=1 Tax=Actinomadura craniellae TaxID=2231787 RepID=A0A365H4E2_9ACTN|nr:asparagine synthase-related protein [Actinomadura craniellae]RAY13888.1 hypothetical protein DPM19_16420 [Actinomadura craniellae]